jgi:hypothetical protein
VADYQPVIRVNALALRGDGKTIRYARRTTVCVIDFQSAFAVEALP